MKDVILLDSIDIRTKCYLLIEKGGMRTHMTYEDFDNAEKNGEINVVAVAISKRIIERVGRPIIKTDENTVHHSVNNQALQFKTIENNSNYIKKVQMLGNTVSTLLPHLMLIKDNETITLASDVSIMIIDAEEMFKNEQFIKIDLTGVNMSLCKSTKDMFFKCNAKEIDMSNLDMTEVKNMDRMFYYAMASKINFEGVTTKM